MSYNFVYRLHLPIRIFFFINIEIKYIIISRASYYIELTAINHPNGQNRCVTGADGFRTFHTFKVCVFCRLRACGEKFTNAGGVGRGVSVAGGFAPVRRPVRAPAVKLIPETKRFGPG